MDEDDDRISEGMLFSLGSTANDEASKIILSQTRSNSNNLAQEVAAAIEQQLSLVGNSICAITANYGRSLLGKVDESSHISSSYAAFQQKPTFREYNFVPNCVFPQCPTDYGTLYNRSRVPKIVSFEEGSIDHSSLYIYSSQSSQGLRNDTAWQAAFVDMPVLSKVQDALALQDPSLKTMYFKGPRTTLMFYLSTIVRRDVTLGSSYYSLHRTYPGIRKDLSTYNPTKRPWFQNASSRGVHLYGPYRESFTKQSVITLSFKQNLSVSDNFSTSHPVEVIGAAVILIDDLRHIVNRIQYPDDGFAAVIAADTNQVLVWGNRTDIYNSTSSTFQTIDKFDANLPVAKCSGGDDRSSRSFEYTDSGGQRWIVSCLPFFSSVDSSSGVASSAMLIFVFSNYESAIAPLESLNGQIQETTDSVTLSTVVVLCITIGIVIALVLSLITYITHPLVVIRSVSLDLITLMAEDEDQRDYAPLLEKAMFNLHRTDEVGSLACDFYHILCLLNNKAVIKRSTPKYPKNPFYLSIGTQEANRQFNWMDLEKAVATVAQSDVSEITPHSTGMPALHVSNTTQRNGFFQSLFGMARLQGVEEAPSSYQAVTTLAVSQPVGSGENSSAYVAPVVRPDGYAEITTSRPIGFFTSLKSQLVFLVMLLMTGLTVAMVLTVVTIRNTGDSWSSSTSDYVTSKQLQNLQAIARTKSFYVQTAFEQMTLDLLTMGGHFNDLMNLQVNTSHWISDRNYFPSYSIDPANPFKTSAASNPLFSGYYVSGDVDCSATNSCSITQEDYYTRLTSLMDTMASAYFYNGSYLSFVQMALEKDGFTRYWPYRLTSANSHPTNCLIDTQTRELCKQLYEFSACSNPEVYSSFPPYEARCRIWYDLSWVNPVADTVLFQYPRRASDGYSVTTGSLGIFPDNNPALPRHGVFISNFLASKLSENVNQLKILKDGYSFLIDRHNFGNVVLHPKASAACTTVRCAEGLNAADYEHFLAAVVDPYVNNSSDLGNNVYLSQYSKAGKTWRVAIDSVKAADSNVDYLLIATVSNGEVLQASRSTEDAINGSVGTMVALFVIIIILYIVILIYVTKLLIRVIVNPLNDVRTVLQHAIAEDFSHDMPTKATSSDVFLLLEALSQLLVALRFGSDSYARGDQLQALSVFSDALQLFTTTGNVRGIGASLNNLAAVELALGNCEVAEALYRSAIENAEEQYLSARRRFQELPSAVQQVPESHEQHALSSTSGAEVVSSHEVSISLSSPSFADIEAQTLQDSLLPEDAKSAQRLLSDRRGNLAVCYLQQRRFAEAFGLLERCLTEDEATSYLKGYIVKQGTLGQFYLMQGNIEVADQVLTRALQFVCARINHPPRLLNDSASLCKTEDIQAFYQVALYNVALLVETKKSLVLDEAEESAQLAAVQSIEDAFMRALLLPTHVDMATVKKIFQSLIKLYDQKAPSGLYQPAKQLIANLAKQHHVALTNAGARSNKEIGVLKRVVFAIDYSGSMNGIKIQSAVASLRTMLDSCINVGDYVSIVKFTKFVRVVLELTEKNSSTKESLLRAVDKLNNPKGATAMYDAIDFAFNSLVTTHVAGTSLDWIVVLTDGKDNSSALQLQELLDRLSTSAYRPGIIIIGVGTSVVRGVLESIVETAGSKGVYFAASANQNSIAEVFGQVGQVIQGQVILEEF
eukprot:gene25871-31244_t